MLIKVFLILHRFKQVFLQRGSKLSNLKPKFSAQKLTCVVYIKDVFISLMSFNHTNVLFQDNHFLPDTLTLSIVS